MLGTVIVKGKNDSNWTTLQTGDSYQDRRVAADSKCAGKRQSATTALTAVVATILLAFAAPANIYGQGEKTVTKLETSKPVPVKSGHIEANGVNYYHEIHGKGEPLLMLHGGLGSIDLFEMGLGLGSKNGETTSMAVSREPVQGVVRLSGVYTPREKREHGYAAARVHALSQHLRGRGYRCILYTDLGNPTSNSIYRRIGYKAVAEVLRYRFD